MTRPSKHMTVSATAFLVLATFAGVAAPASAASAVSNGACWNSAGSLSALTAVGGRSGPAGMQLRGRAANTAPVELRSVQSAGCGTPVTPARAYTIVAWYQATSMVRPIVYTYSRAAGWKKWFIGDPYSASTPWSKIESTTPPVPAGTEQIGLGFTVDGTAKLVLADVSTPEATAAGDRNAGRSAPFSTSFADDSTLVTNEYAYWNPARADSRRSSTWTMTSGSLFNRAGSGYTGKIDDGRPDAKSAISTDSSTFRLHTVRNDFADVNVAFKLSVAELSSTRRTPPAYYDGVHIWLRFRSQFNLYAVSVARRDGKVVIKKKCPVGSSNDGTYYTLGKEIAGSPITLLSWSAVSASARNNPSGTVTIALSAGGKVLVSAVDTGIGCAPITEAGAVGIRGDNARFSFKNFTVANL
jgi:hypothetical protein